MQIVFQIGFIMIDTLYIADMMDKTNPFKDVKRNIPYFVIGVEGDDYSDLALFKDRWGKQITIDNFATVPNPKYLMDSSEHMLQLAWITVKD